MTDTQTKTRTKKHSPTEAEKGLSHKEATWVAAWLKSTDKATTQNYLLVYEMLPSVVAKTFDVSLDDVHSAMRGEKR